MKRTLLITGAALLLALVATAPAVAGSGQQATCKDVYKIYQSCYDGGKQMDMEGCGYLVQALGPRLMGEEGLSGMSAALTVAMCKQGCEDGAKKKSAMSLSTFKKNFCDTGLK